MAAGVRVQLTLLPTLLPALAVKTRPLAADVQRSVWPQPVRFHAASVLTCADVARFSGGYLALRRPLFTALASRSGRRAACSID